MSFSGLGRLSPFSLLSDRQENWPLERKPLWHISLVFRGYSQCSIARVSDWHLNLTYCFPCISLLLSLLGRLINPPGFWWLPVRLSSPNHLQTPFVPLSKHTRLLLCSCIYLPLGLAVSARHFNIWDCYYPRQTAVGGFFINLFADVRETHCRKALWRWRVSPGQRGWEKRITQQLPCKKLRNSLLLCKSWITPLSDPGLQPKGTALLMLSGIF